MAKITAASIEYGVPYVTKVGGVLFTATKVTIASTATEYPKGGVELLPEKLGLTDGLVSSNGEGGTGGPIGTIWCNPLLAEVKASEFQKGAFKSWIAQINTFEGKNPVLTLTEVKTAAAAALELAENTAVSGYFTTVFCFGR
jgi:hypothetical protein